MLKKYLQCDKELQETKKKLNENQIELNDAKGKLEATVAELEVAKKDIVKLEERFVQQRNEIIPLIHKSTEIISRHINDSRSKSTKEIFKSALNTPLDAQPSTQTIDKKIEFIEFNKLIQQQQKSYSTKIEQVFNNIKVGQIHYLNEGEYFFKLELKRNHRFLYIHLDKDLTQHRKEPNNVFSNKNIVLWGGLTSYHLYVSIRRLDEKNSKCFLIDKSHSGNNLFMTYDFGNRIFEWDRYKDRNDEVIFHFTKE